MGAGRGRSLCALWGGISLGLGTLAFALFSPASVGCSTNLVVLTHGTVTARGCAAYSVVAHLGVGLIVLGAVLLLGSFALAVRLRRQAATTTVAPPADAHPPSAPATTTPSAPTPPDVPPVEWAAPATVRPTPVPEPLVPTPREVPVAVDAAPAAPAPTPAPGRSRPIAPGEDVDDAGDRVVGPTGHADEGPDTEPEEEPAPLEAAVRLPPGWYGNPNNPDRPVQWWDGTRLTDRPY
jgi:hypothetical protein